MPIYEYECRQCGRRFEHLLRSGADLPEKCPACGNKQLQKVLSSFSVAVGKPSAAARPACQGCDGASCPYK